MVVYEENEVIREVADKIREWGVSSCGNHDWFSYWEEVNRRGNFKLKNGAVAILNTAELRLALDLASEPKKNA
jgi:hypothetical protein